MAMAAPGTTFISYSRSDSAFVLRLCQDLRASGASVWLDVLDIRPGDDWDESIGRGLAGASRLIIVLSPAAVASDHVLDEVGYALDKERQVLPILLEDCEVPYRLNRIQYVDFRGSYERGLNDLATALGMPSPDAKAAEDAKVDALRKSARSRKWRIPVACVLAGVAITLAVVASLGGFGADWWPLGGRKAGEAAPEVARSALTEASRDAATSAVAGAKVPFKDAYRLALHRYIAEAPSGFVELGAEEFADWRPTVRLPSALECRGSGYPREPVIECVVYRVEHEIEALRKFEELIELTQAVWPGAQGERMNLFWAVVSKDDVPALVSFNGWKEASHYDVVVSVRPRR